MSGEQYQIVMAPSAYRRYGKFSEEPHRYEELNTDYRIVEDKNRIEVVLINTRESLYHVLRRIMR
jgi:hypothetical protein